jgi:hypothetical protein
MAIPLRLLTLTLTALMLASAGLTLLLVAAR